MKKEKILRVSYYCIGMIVLALGITLNTKTGLGVSPIVSVPYCISSIININFGNMTLIFYCIFVAAQFIIKGRNSKIYDVLQIPLSIVFTRFMNLFAKFINIPANNFLSQLILLVFAIIFTGVGAAMSLNMRLIPNPGDGIVQALSDKLKKKVGFTKNCFDLFNIIVTITICLLFKEKLIGIGIGTVIAVLGIGRTVALFNHFFKEGMIKTAGMETKEEKCSEDAA